MVDHATRRRIARDLAADAGLMLGAACYAFLALLLLLDDPAVSSRSLTAEVVLAAVGCAAVWLRRRWPVGLAVVLLPLSLYGFLVDGAMLVALFTVAVHRRARTALVLGAIAVVGTTAWYLVLAWDDPGVGWVVSFTAVGTAGAVGWGLFVRHRRQLILSLHERAARAEAEATLRAEQAQHEAREELAREMHDVLGHRLSLLTVHAGALEYRKQVSHDEVVEAAGVIRATAHQALQDLREVIGILRAPTGELPQPAFGGIGGLVAETRQAGTPVDLVVEVRDHVPDSVGRTAYRIVQEGLTNARNHAPGAAVTVTVEGGKDTGLTVEVRNDTGTPSAVAVGSGRGLAGLTERVALLGGTLEHGPRDGGFTLSARLPWPT